MTRIALNLAASTLVLGATTFGCVMNGIGTGPALASTARAPAQSEAGSLFDQAGQALAQGRLAEAVHLLERSVAASPRDAGYRLMLADAYMKSGRFKAAETTYRDVLDLDPGRTRAALTLALMKVANGNTGEALADLDRLEGQAAPADLGLAFALAGSPQRAVDILEPAARLQGATARVRQNLALAYAFGGDWQRARTIAAQDVSPSELANRMTQWAQLAQRSGPGEQVAAMIGVSPAADPGQPVRLALHNPAPVPSVIAAPAPVQVAVASPAPADVPVRDVAPEPAPVALAQAAPIVSASLPSAAPAEVEQAEWGIAQDGAVALPEPEKEAAPVPARIQFAAATEALIRPEPVVMKVKAASTARPVTRREVAAAPAIGADPVHRSAKGRYVVQIGAFSSAANAERAWQQAETRFGLDAEQPVTMTIDRNGRLLHRVAISGFEKRGEANRVCRSIVARGGECFVRNNAGDAAIAWAARYTRRG